MNQVALEEQLSRLEKEVRIGGTETEEKLFELRAEIDRLRLEVAAVKSFLCAVFPSFEEQFPQILSRTIEEVNPEFQ